MEKPCAVLTGDIVKSSRLALDALDATRLTVHQAVQDVKGWKRGLVPAPVEFFRGDAWQLALATPGLALRCAAYIRAGLRANDLPDTRIAIGVGDADRINRKRVSLSSGEAFILSGEALDDLGASARMTLAVSDHAADQTRCLTVVVRLCDRFMQSWKRGQADIVQLALWPIGQTHESIADRFDPPVSRQNVSKALDGANWSGLEEAMDLFEQFDWGFRKM